MTFIALQSQASSEIVLQRLASNTLSHFESAGISKRNDDTEAIISSINRESILNLFIFSTLLQLSINRMMLRLSSSIGPAGLKAVVFSFSLRGFERNCFQD
jgi:hypothetical protein